MPHLTILYTPNLESEVDMSGLCRKLANTMLAVLDDAGKPVYPTGGTRVLAWPAKHFAIADGSCEFAFVYLNVRMAKGRSPATVQRAGEILTAATHAYFKDIFDRRGKDGLGDQGPNIGITFQVDEGHESFDAKHSNIHPLFNK
jgi:5-carboxymethyl-2-hydroxymuconate isomerase